MVRIDTGEEAHTEGGSSTVWMRKRLKDLGLVHDILGA